MRGQAALGAWAGFLGGVSMAILAAVLRLFAGIPLLVELVSDRVIPTLSIRRFGDLARRLGGLEKGKEVSLLAFFGILVVAATLAGLVFGIASTLARRRIVTRGLWLLLALGAAATVDLLWPVLEANGLGLSPREARWANVLVIVALFALFGVIAITLTRRMSPSASAEADRSPATDSPGVSRRLVLASGGTLAIAAGAGALARSVYGRATSGPNGYDGLSVRGPITQPITPIERFYVVTKNIVDPRIDPDVWRLDVTGLVERPATFGLRDVGSFPPVEQTQTLECISNGVGGGLMSNAAWRGVRLADLLRTTRPAPAARFAELHAADGYVDVISLDKAMEETTILAYEMNGEPLTDRHGAPVRLLVPGAYGEVSVKWIDRVALIDHDERGYYAKQGWRPNFVTTTSRFDSPTTGAIVGAGRPVSLRGVAFAGDRGISRVEWSADEGTSWSPATITYHPSRLTWALWRSVWRPSATGPARLVVRAVDGRGIEQTARQRGAAPAGATGYHEVRVQVRG
jgi:DMSO/TMAO reductase YedYZ molybdopterin-dependent catalytic subunit